MAARPPAGGAGEVALQRPTGQHEQVGKLPSPPLQLPTQTCPFTANIWLCGAHVRFFFICVSVQGGV